MSIKRCWGGSWLLATMMSLTFLDAAGAGGFAPEEARGRMVAPEGFRVEVFACEPMIRQPLSVTFDERGRAWVIEYLQYPNPAGLKAKTVDQYLRTEYDRVPEPPPHGPRGADRISILEDTDGDGRADKKTVFVEGLNLASGLAVGHGGVFVGQAPYLLFYPDRDKDDKPDGEPEVLVKGFGMQDAHATLNSLKWGPDGWLYGAQGSTVTARVEGVEFQQGIWRYQPKTRRFELFAEGGGNTWGLDFDAGGNAFGSSNGGFIAFHMIQGGNYWKGFAKHGALHNPNTFGYFDAIAYSGPKVGGHVTPGGIIYKADAYPEAFRGAFLGGNLLSNAVYWHHLKAKGSTFEGKHGGTLLDARDDWCRPIDLEVGPDGCVYVVDWYDKRASHLDPRDTWDRSNGRIYRLVYKERKRLAAFDLSKLTTAELVGMRLSANDWYAAEARRLLFERGDASAVPKLKRLLTSDREEATALRDLWALNACGGLDDAEALALLDHPLAGVRRWTIRLVGDDRRMSPSLRGKLESMALKEPDALVRSQMAASCQRWGARDALPILAGLIGRDEDAGDPQIPMMLWWGVERQLRNDRDGVVSLFSRAEGQRPAIAREVILERVARVLASGTAASDLAACARLLAAASGDGEVTAIVDGMEKGLQGKKIATAPAEIGDALKGLWERGGREPSVGLIRMGARLGSAEACALAMARLGDEKAALSDRVGMAELMGQLARPEALHALLDLFEGSGSEAIRPALINALGGYSSPEVARRLISVYPRIGPGIRERVLGLLCTRVGWAEALLDAIGSKRIEARDLRASQVLQVVQLKNQALNERIEILWGRVPGPGSAEKMRRIAEVRGLLPEGDKGNAERGGAVFREQCAACHKLFGEGEMIGPELTGLERGNLDFLLTSVVDPSAMIRKEYQSQVLALIDGRVLDGLVMEETGETLTLIDGNRQKTVIPRREIEERRLSTVSLMPEGILDKVSEERVRDLFKYLQSGGPVSR